MDELWDVMHEFLQVRIDVKSLRETVTVMEKGCEEICEADESNKSYDYLRTINGNLEHLEEKLQKTIDSMDHILMAMENQ